MPSPTYFPRADIDAAKADEAISGINDMVSKFAERYTQPQEPMQPTASKPFDFKSLLPSLTPWMPQEAPADSRAVTTPSAPGIEMPRPVGASGQPAAMPTGVPVPTGPRGDPSGGVEQWDDLVQEASRQYGVPAAYIKGLMHIESGGNPDSVSSAGALGLMQTMPFHYQPGENGMDPRTNIMRGTKIFADNLHRYGGDVDKAAAAYFGAIDAQGNITSASDGNTDGPGYVRQFRDATARYQGAPTAGVRPTAPAAQAPADSPPVSAGASGTVTINNGRGRPIPGVSRSSIGYGPGQYHPDEWYIVDDGRQSQAAPAPEWSPDSPAQPPVTAQMSTGRSGGGIMARLPLQPTQGDTGTGEYDPRDADAGAHEAGYTVPGDAGTGPTSGATAPAGAPASLPPSSSNGAAPNPADDPGGAQFAAQDAYSQPARPTYQYQAVSPGTPLESDAASSIEMPTQPRPLAAQAEQPVPYGASGDEAQIPSDEKRNPAPTGFLGQMGTALGHGATAVYEHVIKPAQDTLDAANEWAIASPLGNLMPQAWGRELAGWDQLGKETQEDQDRLNALVARWKTGDTSVEPEIQALTASLNQRLGQGRSMRQTLLEAGARNPDKTAEGLGSAVGGVAATALAPGLGAGVVRNVAAAALDPVGQATGAAIEGPLRAAEAVGRFGERVGEAWRGARQTAAEANAADTGGATLGMVGPSGEVPRARWTKPSEQALRSEVGARYPDIRRDVRGSVEQSLGAASSEMLADSRYPRDVVHPDLRAEGIGPKIEPQVDMSGRANVQTGPAAAGPGVLDQFNTAAGNAMRGSMTGGLTAAVTDPGSPQGEDESDAAYQARRAREVLQRVGTGAVIGAAGFVGAGALMPRGAGGALQMVGPQGQGGFQNLPGVQRVVQASQRRAARMAALGQAPLNPLQWTRKAFAEAGYSSMIGPATGMVSLTGNVLAPLWAIPKEAARSVARTGNLGEFAQMAGGAFHGMGQLGTQMIDALAARGKYAATPGHEPLSAQTINPIGHAIATSLEVGGRLFSSLPDAVFGTIAQGAGEARSAAQQATNLGLRGPAWKQHVQALLADVEQVRTGATPTLTGTQKVIDEGLAYAKRQTFQDELGPIGKNVRDFATIAVVPDGKGGRKPIPVLGNLVTPFFNTPWNMTTRMMEQTPAGLLMNSQGSRFDKLYDATVGSALLIGIAAGPVASGTITGGGPDDPQKKSEMRSQGWRPYSTLIDGVYVPNRAFGIYGPLLNAAADVHDSIAYSKDKSPGSIASNYVGRLGLQLQQQPYLQGVSNLMQAVQAGQGGGLGSATERYASSTLTRMVPYASTARTIGTAMDPLERTTDQGKNVPAAATISQQVQQGIGMRSGLPVAQDVLGRPQENPQQGAKALFAKTSNTKPDAVIQAFLDGGVDIAGPPQQMTLQGEGQVALTPLQQRRWNTIRGQSLLRSRGEITGAKTLPPAERQAELHRILSEASKDAREAVEPTITPAQRAAARRASQ